MQIHTLRSINIVPKRNGKRSLQGATGFICSSASSEFFALVTNRHVVFPLNPETGHPLGDLGGAPDAIDLVIPSISKSQFFGYRTVEVPLCLHGDVGQALWTDHPSKSLSVDIAAVKIPADICDPSLLVDISGQPEGPIKFGAPPDQVFAPTTQLFVVGYPLGLSGPNATAVWTSAFVASEYGNLDRDYFLVDSRTRSGNSGSPVYKFSLSGNLSPSGGIVNQGRPDAQFAGIYSGRLHKDSDVGKVWKHHLVAEVVNQLT